MAVYILLRSGNRCLTFRLSAICGAKNSKKFDDDPENKGFSEFDPDFKGFNSIDPEKKGLTYG